MQNKNVHRISWFPVLQNGEIVISGSSDEILHNEDVRRAFLVQKQVPAVRIELPDIFMHRY